MVPKPYDALLRAFEAQFHEAHGFVFYERLSFVAPWLRGRGGEVYQMFVAERDRFLSDFRRDAPAVFVKMDHDLLKAIGSLFLSSLVLHSFTGPWFTTLEIALFFVHLAVIFVVENRRLKALWDARTGWPPLGAKLPSPSHASRTSSCG